jgi:hypothetical protein
MLPNDFPHQDRNGLGCVLDKRNPAYGEDTGYLTAILERLTVNAVLMQEKRYCRTSLHISIDYEDAL